MSDTERTFKITPAGLKPVDNPKPVSSFTRLDCVGVPTDSQLGKAALPTTHTVIIDNSAAALKKKLTGTPKMAPNKNLAVGLRPVQKKKKLVSLESWNQQGHAPQSNTPQPNGIACPKCGAELYDCNNTSWSNMNGTFVDIACAAGGCDFSGNRKA